MTFNWQRSWGTAFRYQDGNFLLASIPNGQTYVRIHFRWGVYADSPALTNYILLANNIISAGLVTTIGDGSETPPNARSAPNDAAPPTRRWVYWETRQMAPSAVDGASGVVTWRDTGATEPTDTKGQVFATGVPGGQTLNLWFTWAANTDWAPEGSSLIWGGFSVLVRS